MKIFKKFKILLYKLKKNVIHFYNLKRNKIVNFQKTTEDSDTNNYLHQLDEIILPSRTLQKILLICLNIGILIILLFYCKLFIKAIVNHFNVTLHIKLLAKKLYKDGLLSVRSGVKKAAI